MNKAMPKWLQAVPYQKVVSMQNGHEEVFELYQLGRFNQQGKIENVELVELQTNADYRPHFHVKSSAMIYIIQGDGVFLLEKEEIQYAAGSQVFIPAGFLHGFKTNTATVFLSIQSPGIINELTGEIDIHYEEEMK